MFLKFNENMAFHIIICLTPSNTVQHIILYIPYFHHCLMTAGLHQLYVFSCVCELEKIFNFELKT